MRRLKQNKNTWRRAYGAWGLMVSLGLTGCQVDIGGQTLPSANYLKDDIQYFPPGPEFKLSREAAAQKAFTEDQAEVEAQR